MRCRTASPRSCSHPGQGRRRGASWSSPGAGRCRSTPTHGHRPGHDDNDDDDHDDHDDEDLVLQPSPPVGELGVADGEGCLGLLHDGDCQRLVLRTHDLYQPTLGAEQIPRIRRYVYYVDI